jgi:hypothetical protein
LKKHDDVNSEYVLKRVERKNSWVLEKEMKIMNLIQNMKLVSAIK